MVTGYEDAAGLPHLAGRPLRGFHLHFEGRKVPVIDADACDGPLQGRLAGRSVRSPRQEGPEGAVAVGAR